MRKGEGGEGQLVVYSVLCCMWYGILHRLVSMKRKLYMCLSHGVTHGATR